MLIKRSCMIEINNINKIFEVVALIKKIHGFTYEYEVKPFPRFSKGITGKFLIL